MNGSGEQPSLQTAAASEVKVKVELINGSYKCFICNHSVYESLGNRGYKCTAWSHFFCAYFKSHKHALAAATRAGADGVLDDANLVLHCPMCTGKVYHAACGGADFRTLCSTCGEETVEQWQPWNQPNTPCEGSGASGKDAAADDAGDERVDHVPSAPAASNVRAKSKFLPFKHALLRARSLKLKGQKEWEAWSKRGERPANIPAGPNRIYKHDGWQGWGHWLGTGNVAPKCKKGQQFLPFEKALLYARSLKRKNQKEWREWAKSGARPANIPAAPDIVYKHGGWQGYGHWLGTGTVALQDKQFLPFKEALLHARSLKLKTKKDWMVWCKCDARPATNMPSCPNKAYKHDGWQGYGHWLGTGNVGVKHQQFLPFKEALLHARSLKLKGQKEWRAWCKSGARPANMPSTPDVTYKHEGWQRYGHWLGTGNFAAKDHQFLPLLAAARQAPLPDDADDDV